MPQHPAVALLHQLTQEYPFIWRNFAAMQEWRRRFRARDPRILDLVAKDGPEHDPDWPDWCWSPSGLESAMLVEHTKEALQDPTNALPRYPKNFPYRTITALSAWRPTQGIYRFDQELFDSLIRTPVTGNLPAEVLQRLPAWCVYIEIPEDSRATDRIGRNTLGYFGYLDYDPIGRAPYFGIVLLMTEPGKRDGPMLPLPVGIPITGTIEEGLRVVERDSGKVVTEDDNYFRASTVRLLRALFSPILYLCAEEADVPRPEKLPERVVTTKKGKFISPLPKRPAVYDCGVRIGAQLRRARELREHNEPPSPPTGRTVQPHIRAAHWHTFLAGPRDQERQRRVKWLPPIMVKLDDVPDVATVHPVKDPTC